jgi:hypothetical protein
MAPRTAGPEWTTTETVPDGEPARPVPALPWGHVALLALLLCGSALSAWEFRMQALGLLPGDLGDGSGFWAVERRRIDQAGPQSVVILGSSRILFDTDLNELEAITGRTAIQLALPGTSPRAFLQDLAENTDYRGLVLIGVTPTAFFRLRPGLMDSALEYARTETPSQRFSHRLFLGLARTFGFIDADYTLIKLLRNHPYVEREGVEGPYGEVWKIATNGPGRQTFLWSRIESDPYLREHARLAWGGFRGDPIADGDIRSVIAAMRRDIQRIRERGGQVVFIRPPSGGPLRDNENKRVPRAWGWDRLLRETGASGIHFEDYPAMQGLDLPEWSHLSRSSAIRFTRAFAPLLVGGNPENPPLTGPDPNASDQGI